MSIYYIDMQHGKGDGKTPDSPRKTYRDIALQPGDRVLFKRGMEVFDCLETQSGTKDNVITYGAYGEGEKPIFNGSVDVSDPAAWEMIKENIWKCHKEIPLEACNFIFDGGKSCGTLRWSVDELKEQGDWTDSRMGDNEVDKSPEDEGKEAVVLLYSEKNPGEYYKKIECACRRFRSLGIMKDHVIIQDLCFKNNGVHGLAGNGENIIVRNCEFLFIGGCVWSKKLKIRFGNGVEFWNVSRNVQVVDNYFYDIYDSGVTHQGSDEECQVTEDAHFDRNVFVRCGMGAYEGRDLVPRNLTFNDNICIDAGEGFSKNGVIMPRSSEIWPQPMGHHVFIWRMKKPTEGGSLQIKGNTFHNAPYGGAIYSIVDPLAEAQFDIDENIYYTENQALLNHIDGTSYVNFESYQASGKWDANSVYKKTDVDKYIR